MAAVLTSPSSAVVSHACAAHLWGLEGFGPPGIIDITVERHEGGRTTRGVRIHESLAFHLIDVATPQGRAGARRRSGDPRRLRGGR